jgi:two-component system, CAI-1 autoinducer sensor kinase/phosphatase CqsS
MYSILPALTSLLFLGCGAFLIVTRGLNRVTQTFALVGVLTSFWQFSWALLFQVREPQFALLLAKLGYLAILFLPTALYQFIIELSTGDDERPALYLSYGLAAVLAFLLMSGDGVVDGVTGYFFGFYPHAGRLHFLHVLQTAMLTLRALHLLHLRQRIAVSIERERLHYRLASLVLFACAAVDYLANYEIEFYPPGVLFIALSLGLMMRAVSQPDLSTDPAMLAASIAHEMRTPLLAIRAQARALGRHLPELVGGYRQGGAAPQAHTLGAQQLERLGQLARQIETEVTRANFVADMMLASAGNNAPDRHRFAQHSMRGCVEEALARYPFEPATRAKVTLRAPCDFLFYGCDVSLVYVFYNLLKNALHGIAAAGRGDIVIAFQRGQDCNRVLVTDTGAGIAKHVLPHVFDPLYTTRQASGGSGMGLAFCLRALNAFDAKICCQSQEGRHTTFLLEFPKTADERALSCIA